MTLIINGSKLTGRVLKEAIARYLVHRKEKSSKARADITTMTDIEVICLC